MKINKSGVLRCGSDFIKSKTFLVSRSEALHELKNHGIVDLSEFFNDIGDRKEYSGYEILAWLGY